MSNPHPSYPSIALLRYVIVIVIVDDDDDDSIYRKLWLSTVEGYVVLVNSTYNLSYLLLFPLVITPSLPSLSILPLQSPPYSRLGSVIPISFLSPSHSRSDSFARTRIRHLSPSYFPLPFSSPSSSSFTFSSASSCLEFGTALHIYRHSSSRSCKRSPQEAFSSISFSFFSSSPSLSRNF